MRIISGIAKGHRLKSLKNSNLRPTSDLIRGAIFSALASMDVDLSRVIDFYAGTGAMGIEALSRGAEWADFVEKDPKLCRLIKENVEIVKFTDISHTYCTPAKKSLSFLNGTYMLVFIDPPYAEPGISDFIQTLAGSTIVNEKSTIVVEHSIRRPLEITYGNYRQIKQLNHGDTIVSIYQYALGGNS